MYCLTYCDFCNLKHEIPDHARKSDQFRGYLCSCGAYFHRNSGSALGKWVPPITDNDTAARSGKLPTEKGQPMPNGKFNCPSCKKVAAIYETWENVTFTTEILGVDEDGELMLGEQQNTVGRVVGYNCSECGASVMDSTGHSPEIDETGIANLLLAHSET